MLSRKLGVIGIAALLCGCAVARQIQDRNEFYQARDAYKACLLAHTNDAAACESDRRVFELTGKTYTRPDATVVLEQR